MTDPPATADSSNPTDVGDHGESPPGPPRWLKVFGIIGLVLVVLFVARHLANGGFHGHALP